MNQGFNSSDNLHPSQDWDESEPIMPDRYKLVHKNKNKNTKKIQKSKCKEIIGKCKSIIEIDNMSFVSGKAHACH